MCFLLDHGKILLDYLSVFGSYLKENGEIRVIPLGFLQVNSKTANEVCFSFILSFMLFVSFQTAVVMTELCERIGVTYEEMSRNVVCTDGASAMLKLGRDHYQYCESF